MSSGRAVLDLFSGIGGFSLGLERAGWRTVAFCEIEPYCRAVLRKHWPDVPCYTDVRDVTGDRLAADGIVPDVVCGGFPCQDISAAGRGAGLDGERSGLWFEMHRVIAEVRPSWVIIENVSLLRSRGLDVVLRQLAAIGYDAEWHCIPAAAVGAPHRRDRVWIVAYPNDSRQQEQPQRDGWTSARIEGPLGHDPLRLRDYVADAPDWQARERDKAADHPQRRCEVAHAEHGGREGRHPQREGSGPALPRGPAMAHTGVPRLSPPEREAVLSPRRWEEGRAVAQRGWWSAEPDVGRVAHGVPRRVDRLRALGNAAVPKIPEIIGRALVAAEEASAAA